MFVHSGLTSELRPHVCNCDNNNANAAHIHSCYCRWVWNHQPHKPIKIAAFSFSLCLCIKQMLLILSALHCMQVLYLISSCIHREIITCLCTRIKCNCFFFLFCDFTGTKNRPQMSVRGVKRVSTSLVWVWCPMLLKKKKCCLKQRIDLGEEMTITQVSKRAEIKDVTEAFKRL